MNIETNVKIDQTAQDFLHGLVVTILAGIGVLILLSAILRRF